MRSGSGSGGGNLGSGMGAIKTMFETSFCFGRFLIRYQPLDDGDMESNELVTRSLLRCGVVAGPFYLAVALIQVRFRDGFDLARHSLSVLANGPGGWVQTANFVLTGLMVLAAAIGFGRVLGPKSRGATWFLGGYGVAMIVAAMFPTDPVDGFPPALP